MPTNAWPGIAAIVLLALTIWGLISTPGITLPEPGPPCTVERLAATVAATPTPRDANVVTSLLAVETAAGVPRLDGRLIISTSSDRPEIAALRSLTPGRPEYRAELQQLLGRNGIGPFTPDQVNRVFDTLRHAPLVTIVDRVATMLFPAPENDAVFGYGGRSASNWEVDAAGIDLVFRTWGTVPEGTTWQGAICLDDMDIVAEGVPPQPITSPEDVFASGSVSGVTPDLTVNDGSGSFFWTQPGDGETNPPLTRVQVRARPDVSTVIRLALFTGGGWFLARAWFFSVLIALPLAALWLLRPRITPGTVSTDLAAAISRQRTAALVLVQLLGLGLLTTAVAYMRGGSYLNGTDEPNALPVFGYLILLAVGIGVVTFWYVNAKAGPRSRWFGRRFFLILVVIGLAIWLIWVDSTWTERWTTISRTLLAFGFGQFAAAGERLRELRQESPPGQWMSQMATANIVVGVILATLAGTVWIAAALVPIWVIGCFAFGMVQLVVALLPAEGSAWNTPRWLPAISVVAIGFGVATLVQWAWWTTFNQVRLPTREVFFEDPGAGFAALASEVQPYFANFAEFFLMVIPDLLSFVLLVGIVGVLAASANAAVGSLMGDDGLWLRGLLLFLFATFVVGYGGEVLGFRFPLAWLSVFVLAPITLRSPALVRVAPASSGSDSEDDAATQAPGMSWWASGCRAAGIGAVLAKLPVSYFLFVLGSVGGARLVSRDANFGAVTLVSSLASEFAFWVVAAFVFGCLYSSLAGGVGPVRGLLLAGVFAGARGLELLVLGGDGVVWLVRSFELALFLAVIGAWLDAQNLQPAERNWRSLLTTYRIDNLQTTVGYFYPIAGALLGVIKLLQGGQVFNAVDALVTQVIMALPPVPTV